MSKTKEELNAIKEEFETLNGKLNELTEEELAQVIGGNIKLGSTTSWFGDSRSINELLPYKLMSIIKV